MDEEEGSESKLVDKHCIIIDFAIYFKIREHASKGTVRAGAENIQTILVVGGGGPTGQPCVAVAKRVS